MEAQDSEEETAKGQRSSGPERKPLHTSPPPGDPLTRRAPPRPAPTPPSPAPAPPRPAATCATRTINERAAAARGLGLRGRPLQAPANREAAYPRGPRALSLIGRLSPAAGRAVNQGARRPRLTLAVPLWGRAACTAKGTLGSRLGRGYGEGLGAWGPRVQPGKGLGGV